MVPWRELEAAESPIARISHCSWRRRLTAGRRYSCRRRLDIGSVANRRGDERPAGGSGAKLTGGYGAQGVFCKTDEGLAGGFLQNARFSVRGHRMGILWTRFNVCMVAQWSRFAPDTEPFAKWKLLLPGCLFRHEFDVFAKWKLLLLGDLFRAFVPYI